MKANQIWRGLASCSNSLSSQNQLVLHVSLHVIDGYTTLIFNKSERKKPLKFSCKFDGDFFIISYEYYCRWKKFPNYLCLIPYLLIDYFAVYSYFRPARIAFTIPCLAEAVMRFGSKSVHGCFKNELTLRPHALRWVTVFTLWCLSTEWALKDLRIPIKKIRDLDFRNTVVLKCNSH